MHARTLGVCAPSMADPGPPLSQAATQTRMTGTPRAEPPGEGTGASFVPRHPGCLRPSPGSQGSECVGCQPGGWAQQRGQPVAVGVEIWGCSWHPRGPPQPRLEAVALQQEQMNSLPRMCPRCPARGHPSTIPAWGRLLLSSLKASHGFSCLPEASGTASPIQAGLATWQPGHKAFLICCTWQPSRGQAAQRDPASGVHSPVGSPCLAGPRLPGHSATG